ncbi:unnamed protein product [Thelazia callipaeda]|uniref:Uncharacterized protein n=1 Tax=Thelazia callipaeda TaxID=103827 RepID=A0A0N5CSK4_THECL|nr:unnamed protein product [Thelazia callipaeda]
MYYNSTKFRHLFAPNSDPKILGPHQMPFNENGARFVKTNGRPKLCTTTSDCDDHREPTDWCRPSYYESWT